MNDQGWTEVSAVTKRRAAWAFFGLCPAQEATQDTWIFNLTDTSDQTCHTVTIQVDVHTPKQLPQQVPVAAPRRSRTLAMFMPQQDKKTTEVPPADAPAKEEQGVPVLTQQGRATATASGERRERSRTLPVAHAQIDTDQESDVEHQTKKTRNLDPSDPDEAIKSLGWQRWDAGGEGDCFFRATSVFSNKKLVNQPSKESI